MAYIGNLTKSELSALLSDAIAPYLKEVMGLREDLAEFKGQTLSNSKELYSIKDLTTLFKVSAATIHNWTKQGKLIKHKIGGRTVFKKEDVEKLINYSKKEK